MNSKMRMTAAALTAALAIGVAAPAASAVENRTSQTVSSVATTAPVRDAGAVGAIKLQAQTQTGSAAAAGQDARSVQVKGMSSLARQLVKKIVDSKYGKAAIKAAKKGRTAFKNWVNSLSNFNPLKWAIKAAPAYVLDEVITYLVSHF
ncbi:hypothetical protein [Streptomyces sp. NPDC058657]|uniref:hypothetical protein n=1 Tax=unclassified Streptomyces TaxID=2593676 RepID=UPI00364A780E